MRAALVLAAALSTANAVAADPPPAKAPTKPKPRPKAPSFTLPDLGEVPRADGARRSTNDVVNPASRTAATDAKYQVLAVTHARAFSQSASGAVPVAPLTAVKLRADPQRTEKFATAIKVRCPQRQSAEIEVAILDPRGTTALSAAGQLSYRGAKGDDAEWIVDWDPSPVIGPGSFQVLVRIAGQPLGTWPLKVERE